MIKVSLDSIELKVLTFSLLGWLRDIGTVTKVNKPLHDRITKTYRRVARETAHSLLKDSGKEITPEAINVLVSYMETSYNEIANDV